MLSGLSKQNKINEISSVQKADSELPSRVRGNEKIFVFLKCLVKSLPLVYKALFPRVAS